MAKMSKGQLLAIVNEAESDALNFNSKFMRENEKNLSYYLQQCRGDEIAGQSKVISSDVHQVVESLQPSLVRVMLGSESIMEFRPNTDNPVEVAEAEEKTKYINWLIREQPTSFKVQHDWIKDSLIQKFGAVKFEFLENETSELKEYEGLTDEELVILTQSVSAKLGKDSSFDIMEQSVEIAEDGTPRTDIKFKIKYKKREFLIRGVPTEDFFITEDTAVKEDAYLIGDRDYPTKSQLIEEGFDPKVVKRLQPVQFAESTGTNESPNTISLMKDIRFEDQAGGDETNTTSLSWPSEIVERRNLYIKVDYDDDGIAERRHVVKVGQEILSHEQFDIAPYAIFSAISMPHKAIGQSYVDTVIQTQDVKTILFRQILDNIYRVNNGRTVVNDMETNIDDLLTVRPNGIVRTNGDPRAAVAQLETPYIGQQALQVVQYVDSVRAAETGQMLANQGLDADNLHKETATRFEGIEEAGSAKVELVARVLAETGYRDLFEGLAWMASHYQDDETEIMVLGKPLTVDPSKWRFEHRVTSNVGLSAGDSEQQLQNLSGLLQIHNRLAEIGSPLTDHQKQYNLVQKISKIMGIRRPDELFNNPEVPQELLMAQNQQLQQQVQQLSAQVENNPLAEAERIKAESDLLQAQAKMQLDSAKLVQEQQEFGAEFTERQRQFNDQMTAKLTELELKYSGQEPNNPNIPGSLV